MSRINLIIFSVLFISACQSTQNQPLTFGMSGEQIAKMPPVPLCMDHSNYEIEAVDQTIKNRKINCNKVMTEAYTDIASNANNVDVCSVWMNSTDQTARKAFTNEKAKRKLDCESILSVKAQQDAIASQERARKQAAWAAMNQSLQNQQAINAMNRPRSTYCNGFSCTTY